MQPWNKEYCLKTDVCYWQQRSWSSLAPIQCGNQVDNFVIFSSANLVGPDERAPSRSPLIRACSACLRIFWWHYPSKGKMNFSFMRHGKFHLKSQHSKGWCLINSKCLGTVVVCWFFCIYTELLLRYIWHNVIEPMNGKKNLELLELIPCQTITANQLVFILLMNQVYTEYGNDYQKE